MRQRLHKERPRQASHDWNWRRSELKSDELAAVGAMCTRWAAYRHGAWGSAPTLHARSDGTGRGGTGGCPDLADDDLGEAFTDPRDRAQRLDPGWAHPGT